VSKVRRWWWFAGTPVRLALLGLIRGYRLTLSGLLGGQCRFHPSCSEYAERAIQSVGAARGAGLAVWRILRCSPLSGGGVDPPPGGGRLYDVDIPRGGVAR
jgi:uncharacterized protein